MQSFTPEMVMGPRPSAIAVCGLLGCGLQWSDHSAASMHAFMSLGCQLKMSALGCKCTSGDKSSSPLAV